MTRRRGWLLTRACFDLDQAPAKKAVKKTPAADGEKKKKRKTRKET